MKNEWSENEEKILRREDFLSEIEYGQSFLDRSFWDETHGLYENEAKVCGNFLMFPSLTVLVLEGDKESAEELALPLGGR